MAQSVGPVSMPYAAAVDILNQREIYKQVIDLNQDDEFLDFMKFSGKEAELKHSFNGESSIAPVYHSFYNDPLYVLIDTTGANITGSGTTSITVTGLPANSQNVLVPGTLIYTPAGAVARVQTTPTASGFTAQSVDSEVLTVVAGNKLSAFSDAQEEGSDGPEPMRWNVSTLSNRIQIFRQAIKITDVRNMTGVEVKINGKHYFLPYEIIQGHQKHRGNISLAMWMGRVSTTLFEDTNPSLSGANGYGVQTTRGLNQYIEDYGITDTITTPGTLILADIADQEAQLTANRAPVDYLVVGSQPVISAYSDFLKGLPSSGAMSSVRLNVNGRETDLEVSKFSHGGFNFHLRRLNVLSNTSVINYAASGSTKLDIAKSAYFLPLGKAPTVGKGGGMVDYFRYRYMAPPAGPNSPNSKSNGQTTEVMTGGLAPIPTDRSQNLFVTWTSNMGLEVLAPQKFMRSIVI